MTRTFLMALALVCACACGNDFVPFGDDQGGSAGFGAGAAAPGGGYGGQPYTGGGGGQPAGGNGGSPECSDGDHACEGSWLLECELGSYTPELDCGSVGADCIAGACERDLVTLLRFEEGAGTITVDESPSGLVGTLLGAEWTQGHHGNGLKFVPTSRVFLGDSLHELSLPVTICAWVRIPTNSAGAMVVAATEASDPAPYAGLWLWVNASSGNTISVRFGDGLGAGPGNRNSKTSSTGFANETWTHVAGVIRGTNDASLYIDGADAGGSYSGSALAIGFTSSPFVLGDGAESGAGNTPLNGSIDEVRIYNRELAESEVSFLASQ